MSNARSRTAPVQLPQIGSTPRSRHTATSARRHTSKRSAGALHQPLTMPYTPPYGLTWCRPWSLRPTIRRARAATIAAGGHPLHRVRPLVKLLRANDAHEERRVGGLGGHRHRPRLGHTPRRERQARDNGEADHLRQRRHARAVQVVARCPLHNGVRLVVVALKARNLRPPHGRRL
eukprot:TRINITY_DN1432_c0_g1_i8.p2 TRINITY_DN1432_c0_g1~~TRINITY_DN1432_c0_g1_i8.p2  ORF type:complete len:176 (+),score=3.10 TRINITY_DN1432_c0_g1_i8:347-874(+)